MRLPLISKSTIRKKLLVSMLVLGIVVAVLGYSSFRGVYAYRDLVTTLSSRASEMPLTTELTRSIDELRNGFQNVDIREPMEFSLSNPHHFDSLKSQRHFSEKLHHVHVVLALYKSRLEKLNVDNSFLSDLSDEFEKSAEIAELLNTISIRHQDLLESGSVSHTIQQLQDLERLSKLAHILPTFFSNRMASFRNDVRSGYRTWIALAWSSATLAAFLLIGLIAYARIAVIKPFKELLAGSRRVASGDFAHRIHIESRDELSELADAINLGAASFLSIQRDLNEQVRERSQEVIRNEQLASVGFLAAGVAHEIKIGRASCRERV